jgi:hypothetical protein
MHYCLQAEYTVQLDGDVLRTRLAVTNTDDKVGWRGGVVGRLGSSI